MVSKRLASSWGIHHSMRLKLTPKRMWSARGVPQAESGSRLIAGCS
jgi:hypothetical protein